MRLYKYVPFDENIIKSLIHHYFWLSDPRYFNDPFDCYPYLINWDNAWNQNSIILPHHDIQLGNPDYELNIEKFIKKIEGLVQEYHKRVGITCFSETRDNILMWSHYANNHQGICLGFDVKNDRDYHFRISKVNYVRKVNESSRFTIRDIDNIDFTNPDTKKESFHRFFTLTKSSAWRYEKEHRLVIFDADAFEHRSRKLPFISTDLTQVVFGCKMSYDNKKFIAKLIRTSYDNFNKIQFRSAYEKKNEIALGFKPIKKDELLELAR